MKKRKDEISHECSLGQACILEYDLLMIINRHVCHKPGQGVASE